MEGNLFESGPYNWGYTKEKLQSTFKDWGATTFKSHKSHSEKLERVLRLSSSEFLWSLLFAEHMCTLFGCSVKATPHILFTVLSRISFLTKIQNIIPQKAPPMSEIKIQRNSSDQLPIQTIQRGIWKSMTGQLVSCHI